jgi:hypothetical protein
MAGGMRGRLMAWYVAPAKMKAKTSRGWSLLA